MLIFSLNVWNNIAISNTRDGQSPKKGDNKTQTDSTQKKNDDEKESGKQEVQRVPTNAFDSYKNKVSNIEIYSTNYGILGQNVAATSNADKVGGFWPRDSKNAYIFGGGLWIGAKKRVKPTDTDLSKLSVIGYNPNSGSSWFVPGIIEDPTKDEAPDETAFGKNMYRVYSSLDYSNVSGETNDSKDKSNGGAKWPIWDTNPNDSLKVDRYVGNFIKDNNDRNSTKYPKGPSIISNEDIFSVYKDTDLDRYEISKAKALSLGYPMGMQVEQTIFTFGGESNAAGLCDNDSLMAATGTGSISNTKGNPYTNFIFIKYNVINKSKDTLRDVFIAPAFDMDIGAAANDHTRFFNEDPTLNLGVQWSEASSGDGAKKFGYIGFDFLESPAVDANGFIRKDKKFYSNSEQKGLSTLQNWVIENDPSTPQTRYEFMSNGVKAGDNGAGDKRFLTATGPFNMLPGDTARIVVGMLFADSKSGTATGTLDDLSGLIALDKFAQEVYDKNYDAPRPPDACRATYTPINNGVIIRWDSLSELSVDQREKGLDFQGYKIQRARKIFGTNSDALSNKNWNIDYKTIKEYRLPCQPSAPARIMAAQTGNMSYLGAWWRFKELAELAIDSVKVPHTVRIDTVKRPGLTDSLVTVKSGTESWYKFKYDMFDDANPTVRDMVRKNIQIIMDSVTNHRTFVDVGDDNNDGTIKEIPDDLNQNEKLINGVDYYYRILSYDAGYKDPGTPSKLNGGITGLNEIRATPEAPQSGSKVEPKIVGMKGMGGITNPNFLTIDNERLAQLFAGDTLEFKFKPLDTKDYNTDAGSYNPYWYWTEVNVYSKRSGDKIHRFAVSYESAFSDHADSTIRNIDTSFVTWYPRYKVDTVITVKGTTPPVKKDTTVERIAEFKDASCKQSLYTGTYYPTTLALETIGQYKKIFGLSFDWAGIQYGDSLKFGRFCDSASKKSAFKITNGSSDINFVPGRINYWKPASTEFRVGKVAPSIGQVKLEVEMIQGGTESFKVTKGTNTYEFTNVPYFITKVKNINKLDYKNAVGQNITYQYGYEFPIDPAAKTIIDTLSNASNIGLFIGSGQHTTFAYGWIGVDTLSDIGRANKLGRAKYSLQRFGTPGRYYPGVLNGKDQNGAPIKVMVSHKIVANGSEMIVDFAGMGSTDATIDNKFPPPTPRPTKDLAVGDKFTVDFTGGAVGLPEPGGSILVAINQTNPKPEEYTDELLDKVNIVPNPYYIDHLGQRSTTDKRLFITRLPAKCKIEVFTEAGELVQVIDHVGDNSGKDLVNVNVYDLISSGNRQLSNQLLLFRITTSNGASVIKKAAIVIGGFRSGN
ncbi:MAG: hypothetical protein IPP08_09340 [Chlorobiota bacterium]|nr:MAG: hypothetical protein IPP08_09340 [Chlorobiota bacterium]